MYRSTVFGLVVSFATQAFAASDTTPAQVDVSFAEDTGEVARIESAEYLRTYTQEVASAACFLYNDIDTGLSSELLRESRVGFEKRLNALIHGNEELGIIGGEQRRKTALKLTKIGEEWAPIADAIDALLADPGNSQAVDVIKAKNMDLFEMTDIIVSDIEAQYANPAIIVQADVLLLEIVGRQAMMTQKIAKDACKVFTGDQSQEVKDLLQGSVQIYEASLDALLNGMPSLGIQPAPTPEIAEQLTAIQSDWATVRPIVDTLVQGGSVDRETQVYLFKHMVEEMVRLEELSHAYVQHSKYIY